MPSFDYTAWSTSSQDMKRGINAVRSANTEILPLLKQIVSTDFFSYYAVNLITPCSYFPSEDKGCEMDRCEIQAVRDRDVPPEILNRDLNEFDFDIDGWCRKDMPSDFTEYFDLRACHSRDTAYDGSRVWRFIHTKICFRKQLNAPGNSYKRDYNRFVSGMHSVVSAEILADLGPTQEGLDEYRRRLRDQPGAITNLYFGVSPGRRSFAMWLQSPLVCCDRSHLPLLLTAGSTPPITAQGTCSRCARCATATIASTAAATSGKASLSGR